MIIDNRSIDGEQFVGEQQYYEDQEPQQEHFDQGKDIIGYFLDCPITL